MAKMYGFKDGGEKPSQSYPMLAKGVYIAAIKNVKIDGVAPDQQIVLRLDIIEGEAAGYYTKRYQHDSSNAGKYEAKYKGDFRIQIPNEKNSKREHPEWDASKLNRAIYAIEQSNPGFHFDGDTDHIGELKGKTVGINVRQGTFNGVPFTTIGRLEVADDVRKGLVKPMNDLPDRMSDDAASTPASNAAPAGFTPVETDELPF